MHSRQHQPSSPFYDPKRRLTAEEWALIMNALRAYQHNDAYRSLYEKLEAWSISPVTAEQRLSSSSRPRAVLPSCDRV
ncbi:hypothetical protein GCM10011402_37650 [Paracoccus acridae]|uniref:Clr5 domain-containing protein n=1 Tax=Paracoccus acridae TaxID=1795310 RepID=A0ABQ1VMJ1_9RHOB|nr:hypothetical protein GCM10011402_37650 [Paracoccus acridae]